MSVCVCEKESRRKERDRETYRTRALKYNCRSESLHCKAHKCGLAWFPTAPQVPSTAWNTDGLWVIQSEGSGDTNDLLYHVTPFLLLL